MKKMMLVAAACAMVVAPSMILADDPAVTSVNAVGYYSVTVPANGLALVTPVLESIESGTVEDLFSDLPDGSFIHIWDRQAKGYITQEKTARGGWGATGNNLILRGDAVWVQPPANGQPHVLTFMGEVPASSNHSSTTTVHNLAGIDAVGYAYPVDKAWTNTVLYTALDVGSFVHIWDADGQEYVTQEKTARGGWGALDNWVIKAGQAFWVQPSNAEIIDWVEEVPYEL